MTRERIDFRLSSVLWPVLRVTVTRSKRDDGPWPSEDRMSVLAEVNIPPVSPNINHPVAEYARRKDLMVSSILAWNVITGDGIPSIREAMHVHLLRAQL